MTQHEAIGWSLVATSGLFAVAGAFVTGGVGPALLAASAAFSAAATTWGYIYKQPAVK